MAEALITLKIVSWNINGIRKLKLPIKEVLDSFDADIVCLQETKSTRDQTDENTVMVDGYNSYFGFSRRRSGYSGVATYCKNRISPFEAEEGITGVLVSDSTKDAVGCCGCFEGMDKDFLRSLDSEGRAVITKHKVRLKDDQDVNVVLINVYCPRVDPDKPEREQFKLNFYKLLQTRAEALLEAGCYVIIVGDMNISHEKIDHSEPADDNEFYANSSRQWMSNFLFTPKNQGGKFVDSFRYFYATQNNAFTCWSTATGARQNNYGTRIDYILVDDIFTKKCMLDSVLLPDVKGSDHCPVMGTFHCAPIASSRCPSSCSRYWSEFYGKQVKLTQFLRAQNNENSVSESENGRKRSLPEVKREAKRKIERQPTVASFFTVTNSDFASLQSQESSIPEGCSLATDLQTDATTKAQECTAQQTATADAWKCLLKPKAPPLCKGHKEPCILLTSKKRGPNFKRQFYVCARPQGHSRDPNSRCNYFSWFRSTSNKPMK